MLIDNRLTLDNLMSSRPVRPDERHEEVAKLNGPTADAISMLRSL